MKIYSVFNFFWFFVFCTCVYSTEIKIKNDSKIIKNYKLAFTEGILFGTFSSDEGPFLLDGTVIVPSGQILEFGPGCQIYVGGQNSSIIVYGQIFVRGNAEQPVVFMSAYEKANPWDWSRIYCRSNTRSVFEHCIISNSNSGLVVENGNISIRNSVFENNSLYGLVVKNSEVSLKKCFFKGGHVSAINLLPGAKCYAESLNVQNNITAVSCHKKSVFNLENGSISSNTNGIVSDPQSSISILYADITANINGVISTQNIPSKMREMVFGNGFDIKIVNQFDLEKQLSKPEDTKSISNSNQFAVALTEGFKPGFSALSKPKEPESDFLGNVTAGFKYYRPKSFKNPTDDSLLLQTHYPEKFQPEIQIFMNGRRSNADINLLMDIYGNEWLKSEGYVDKRIFSLSMAYSHQQLLFGDFFENGSETSISGRQITGVKYCGKFKDMGAGVKRFDLTLAAGESEVPKDSGDHEINIYNETVDSGMSIRQQLTYLSSLTFKPTRNSSITTRGIISRDQTEKPLFRSPINDPAVADPIEAQTGCLEGNVTFLEDKLEVFAELDLGTHDTISAEKAKKVAWYNPDFKKAIPEILSLFGSKDFKDHYAFTIGTKTNINEYNFLISGTQIASDFFSAGNPYLETDKRTLTLSAEKQFLKKLNILARYDYRRSSISTSPSDNNDFNLAGEYIAGENKPVFSVDYTCRYEKMRSSERVETEDSSFTGYYNNKALSNIVSIETKQNLVNGIDYGIRYQFLFDNDISKHADNDLDDRGDRFQNQLRTWFSFKIKNYLKNKLTVRLATRNENRDSLEAFSYRINNQTNWNIIPRKLSLNLTGEYSHGKEEDIYTSDNPTIIEFYKAELETKYSISPRLSLSVMGSYEKSYDESSGSAENYDAIITGLYLTCLF